MPKFIEITYVEDYQEKIMSINTDHIIHFKPEPNDEKHSTITLTKVYPSNNSIRHITIKVVIAYDELKLILSAT